jgi:hypothetical protein
MAHSHILVICLFFDVFLTEAFGIPHMLDEKSTTLAGLEPAIPRSGAGALSIMPQGRIILVFGFIS